MDKFKQLNENVKKYYNEINELTCDKVHDW